MTTNFGTVIDRESWEARINEDIFFSTVSISRGGEKSPTSRTNPAERGFAFWDKIANQRLSLPAIGALEILKDMREVETWKINGMLIGAPTLTSAPQDKKVVEAEILQTPFVRRWSEYILSNPLRLTPEQSKDLFDFLLENEQLLSELAEKDEIVGRQQLTDMFKKIAEYGRQIRQRRAESS